MPESVEIKKTTCPSCNNIHEMATGVTGKGAPAPGDYSVCLGCGVVLRFKEDMHFAVQRLCNIPAELRDALTRVQIAVILTYAQREEPKEGNDADQSSTS